MRMKLLILVSLLVTTTALAAHIGCVTINDKSLCELEQNYQYKSDTLSWELPKAEFKDKILSFIKYKMPKHEIRMGAVFLWVNDFNMNSALRVQIWEENKSFIMDVPVDIMNVNMNEDLSIRAAGVLPYPMDFGYTLGEIIVMCAADCTQEHKDWLADCGGTETKSILPTMLLITVPVYSEIKTVANIKAKAEYERLFRSAELSAVLEGNGFRELAFVIYF